MLALGLPALCTTVGAAGVFLLRQPAEARTRRMLCGMAAGCMVCVTAQEMIPQAVEPDEPAGVVSVVLGFALMMALDVAL